MKIKNRQLNPILNALTILDVQHEKLVAPDGKTTYDGKPTFIPKFKNPGKVRYNLAKTTKALKAQADAVNDVLQPIIRELFAEQEADGVKAKILDDKRQRKYAELIKPILDAEEDLDIRPVAMDDLDLENNAYPFGADGKGLADLLGTVIAENDPV